MIGSPSSPPDNAAASLQQLQRDWNGLARKDAMWAVLTGPFGAERSWDPDAFFQTGVDEISSLLGRLGAAGIAPPPGRALDFGCGPGRLTQALAGHFAHVDGVDIASTMIEQARALNRHGNACTYHLNTAGDLQLFAGGSFDFIYSSITLQHMEPRHSRRYIEEFFRVARPGGVAVFQIPSHPIAIVRPQTRQAGPLPPDACRAAISVPSNLRCAPGATLPLRVGIRNLGTAVWSASYRPEDEEFAVRLGNHWRGRFGRMRRFDDLRTGLPFDLAPGASIEIGINPIAPARGMWILELDMVQEHVRWFAEAGSTTARIRIRVDNRLQPGEVQGQPPVMEMHGIPRPEVESLIASAGGELLLVEADESPGPEWASFRYVARRRAM
jgi:SAM-dependent methyltransferase